MPSNIYLSKFSAQQVEQALERAMRSVQSINGIRPTHSGNIFVEGVTREEGGENTMVGTLYTPYIRDGWLCWENNGGLENPEPVRLVELAGNLVHSVCGAAPDSEGNVTLTPELLGALKTGGDTLTGSLAADGHRITDLPRPASDGEPVTLEDLKARHRIFTAELSADWTAQEGVYTQTLTAPGITAADAPHIAPDYSADPAAARQQKEGWALICQAEAREGSILFTCLDDAPAVAIPIQIEVMNCE